MKVADQQKLKASRVTVEPNPSNVVDRYGQPVASAPKRREQRKLDQAQGLVPFAVKLDGELVKQIHALAQERKAGLNEVVSDLLKKGLGK
jgi:hypothetical protein